MSLAWPGREGDSPIFTGVSRCFTAGHFIVSFMVNGFLQGSSGWGLMVIEVILLTLTASSESIGKRLPLLGLMSGLRPFQEGLSRCLFKSSRQMRLRPRISSRIPAGNFFLMGLWENVDHVAIQKCDCNVINMSTKHFFALSRKSIVWPVKSTA
jgi:hypothetical protein